MNRTSVLRLAAMVSFSGLLATTAMAQASPAAAPAAQTQTQTQTQTQAPAPHERFAQHQAERHARHQEKHQQHWERQKNLLQLQPQQQAQWEAYVAAMQPPPRVAPAKHPKDMNTLERLDWKAQMRTSHQKHAERRDQATRSFYASLNAQQQKAFDSLPHAGRSQMGKHRGDWR